MKTFRPLSLRAASLALLAAAIPLAQADETHYVGPDGGSWSSPYWDAGNPNGSLDVYNLTNFRTILDQDYTVRNFTSLGAFTATRTLTGALADRASVVKVSNEFLIDGGGLSNLTVQGVGGHSLVLSGSGNNVLTNVLLKDANLSGGYARVFGTVTADGTTTLNGSELRVLDQSALNVASSGSLAGQGLVSRENGSTFATVDGTLRASGGTLYWDVWQGGGSGSLTADAGANLVLRGNFNGTGSGATVGASLGGTVTLDAGGVSGLFKRLDLTLSGSGNNVLVGMAIAGPGSFSGGYARVYGANSLQGMTTIAGSELRVLDQSALNVAATGSLTGYGLVSRENGSTFATVDGTLRARGGTLYWDVWQGGGSGLLTADAGANLVIRGNFTGQGAGAVVGADPGGTVTLDAGGVSGLFQRLDIVLSGSGNNVLSNATVAGPGSLSGGYARIFGNTTFQGATTIDGSELRVLDQSALNIAASGSLAGLGLVSRENGSTFATVDGLLKSNGGDLSWDVWQGGGAGTLSADANSRLILRGNFNGTGSGATVGGGAGSVFLDGGGMSGLFQRLDLSLSGSGSNVLNRATVAGPANFSGGYARVFGTITLQGAAMIDGSELHVLDQSALSISATGSLAGRGLVSRENGSTFATVDGTLRANGGDLYWDVWQGGGSGLLTAATGANLVLRGNFTGQGAGAVVGADPAGAVVLDGGGMSGLYQKLNLSLSGNGNNVISNVTVAGPASLTGGYARAYGTNSLQGTTVLDGAELRVLDQSALNVAAAGTLHGHGLVSRENGSTFSRIDGTLVADSGTLTFAPAQITSYGTVEATPGNILDVGGSFVQSAGKILADGTIAFELGATVNGGRVEGMGTIMGNVMSVGGTTAPGDSPGTLTVTGNYDQLSGGTLQIEIGRLANHDFDLLAVGDHANLAGTLDILITPSALFDLGDRFRILTAANGVLGTFGAVNGSSFFSVEYGANYVDLVAVQAVPEPATFAALGLGAAALLRRRKR